MNTENLDIRWLQRFSNYKSALSRLAALVEIATERELNDIEQVALIKRFEYTQELSWKVIKNFYESVGETSIQGSRDAFQLAFNRGLITDGSVFMESIKSRNEVAHTYNQPLADKVCLAIVEKYYAAFEQLRLSLQSEQDKRNL